MDKATKQKINKKTADLNNTVDQIDPTNMQNPIVAEFQVYREREREREKTTISNSTSRYLCKRNEIRI